MSGPQLFMPHLGLQPIAGTGAPFVDWFFATKRSWQVVVSCTLLFWRVRVEEFY